MPPRRLISAGEAAGKRFDQLVLLQYVVRVGIVALEGKTRFELTICASLAGGRVGRRLLKFFVAAVSVT